MTDKPQTQGMPVKADPPTGPDVISTGRKVRLIVMLAVLLALGATTIVFRLHERAVDQRQRREVAQALKDMRQGLGEPNVPKAEARWKKIQELDPGNAEAEALLVPYYLAAGRMDDAFAQFNRLAADGAIPAPAAPAGGADPVMLAVLARPDAARMAMQQADVRFIADEGLLAGLARRIVRGAASDRERALLLCDWCALHVEPADPYQLPADPWLAAWRGFGSPEQTAWIYAELARQAGVPCAVVVPPSGAMVRLVQVYPAGAVPFLVDPGRGVPVLDPSSREPLSLSSPNLVAGYGALLGLAGEKADYGLEDLKAATLQRAVHPSLLMPRFVAFDRLCSCLPAPALLSFEPGPLPDGRQAALWALPLQTVQAYDDPVRGARINDAHRWLSAVGDLGNALLLQPDPQADAVVAGVKDKVAKSLSQSGASDATPTLRDTVELLSYWQAVNAHDAGEPALAVKLLKGYQGSYAEGRWKSVAGALLADSLGQAGQADAATEAWRTLPPGRRLYGAMRAAGLLPLVKPPAPAAAAPPKAS